MTVFASALRNTRRPRRIPSVGSLVRVVGSVRVSDQPVASNSRPRTDYRSHTVSSATHGGASQAASLPSSA